MFCRIRIPNLSIYHEQSRNKTSCNLFCRGQLVGHECFFCPEEKEKTKIVVPSFICSNNHHFDKTRRSPHTIKKKTNNKIYFYFIEGCDIEAVKLCSFQALMLNIKYNAGSFMVKILSFTTFCTYLACSFIIAMFVFITFRGWQTH